MIAEPSAGAHSDEAERIVLGSVMLQPDLIDEISGSISSADFYRPVHGAIFAAVTANAALGEPTDPVAIAVTLARFGELAKVGGANYLHTCVSAVPTILNASWYAQQIREHSYARRAEAAAVRLQLAARIGDRESIAGAYDQMQQDLARTGGGSGPAWRSRLTNGATFIYETPDKVPAVWGDGDNVLWAAGEALMLCGPQGVGKTTTAGQVVMARLGLIPDVLGWPVLPGNRRVLYLAMDRPRQAARSLARLARPEWRDALHDRLIVWQGPPPGDFAATPSVLVEMCRAADADTVVVDSIKDAAVGLASDEVGAGYNRARQTAIAAGVEILELHHQRKATSGGGAPKTLADVYGSTWITSGAGSVVLLWGEAGDSVVELVHLKQPMNNVGPLDVIHDHDAGTSRVDQDPTTDVLYLARHQPAGLTARAAACGIFRTSNPEPNQVEAARRRLDGYVRSQILVKRNGERGGPAPKAAAYFLVERREESA